jgi:hypothetical protein
MRAPRLPLLRYSALRLALLYVAIAVVSVSGLLWSIYLYSQRLMDRETELVIEAEGATLREHRGGLHADGSRRRKAGG